MSIKAAFQAILDEEQDRLKSDHGLVERIRGEIV